MTAVAIRKIAEPEPGAAMLEGANVAVTPAGAPLTDNATVEFNFGVATEVRLICAVCPAFTVKRPALAVSVIRPTPSVQ